MPAYDFFITVLFKAMICQKCAFSTLLEYREIIIITVGRYVFHHIILEFLLVIFSILGVFLTDWCGQYQRQVGYWGAC